MSSFAYKGVLSSEGADDLVSLIAYEINSRRPLRAVIWSVPRQEWIYAPAPAARLLFDDRNDDRTRDLDRPGAEAVAVSALNTSLPGEDVLAVMCQEGEAAGWRYGPPRNTS